MHGLSLYDDRYCGPRWRYGLSSRHAVHYLGSAAGRWILFSERQSEDPRFPFGTIDFPREVPAHIAADLDLTLVDTLDGIDTGT